MIAGGMRLLELSNHPGTLLDQEHARRQAEAAAAFAEYEAALGHHNGRVEALREEQHRARSQRHWWTWLRRSLALRRTRSRAPAPPRPSGAPTDREVAITAGMEAELMVAADLGRVIGDDWTLIRGYRNARGEIDHLLLGPTAFLAIESKHRNATVHIFGDEWRFDKFDRYGNLVDQGRIADKRGRSPSEQLNHSADALEHFLGSRGHPVSIRRAVLLTHARSAVGTYDDLTVDLVATSTDHIVEFLRSAPDAIQAERLAELERLIVRDHRFHQTRGRSR